jgi:hypothetical protein
MATEVGHGREEAASRLKERVYITFTALAVVLTLRAHEEVADEAAVTLAIGAFGTVLAVFVADVVSHIAVHAALPRRPVWRHMASTSFGALGVLVIPLLLIGLAVADVLRIETALRASSFALVAALVGIAFLAVRRTQLPWWQKLIVLLAEFALGLVVIALEFLAHG